MEKTKAKKTNIKKKLVSLALIMAIAVTGVSPVSARVQIDNSAGYYSETQVFSDIATESLFDKRIANSMYVGYAKGNEPMYNRLSDPIAKKAYRAILNRLAQGYIAIPWTAMPESVVRQINTNEISATWSITVGVKAMLLDHPEIWWTSYYLSQGVGFEVVRVDQGLIISPFDEITTLEQFTQIDTRMGQIFANAKARFKTFGTNDASIMRSAALYCTQELATYGTLDYQTAPDDMYGLATVGTLGLYFGKEVCGGYVSFYLWAAHVMNIPAVPVFGYMSGQTDGNYHEWAKIYVDGAWHYFEATNFYRDDTAWTYTADYQAQDNPMAIMLNELGLYRTESALYSMPDFNSKTKIVAPKQVTGVKAVRVGKKKQTKITWTKRPKATGYRIYISKDGGKTWKKLKTLVTNEKSFTYNKYNKKYKYKVRAYLSKANMAAWGKCSKAVKTK